MRTSSVQLVNTLQQVHPPAPPLPPPPPPPLLTVPYGMENSFTAQQQQGPVLKSPELRAPFDHAPTEDICNGKNRRTSAPCTKPATWKPDSFLPTCRTHKDQLISASRCCDSVTTDGQSRPCNRLIVWSFPFFKLCQAHAGSEAFPCYITRLPPELLGHILYYCMPGGPVTSEMGTGTGWSNYHSLSLVNREFYHVTKDYFHATSSFTITVESGGIFMAGRTLYEPPNELGLVRSNTGDMSKQNADFLRWFDFSAVKNYNIEILLSNLASCQANPYEWNLEVELYDRRDSLNVLLSFLKKSTKLHRLNVFVTYYQPSLSFLDFPNTSRPGIHSINLILSYAWTLTEPLLQLRNVLRPRIKATFLANLPIQATVTARCSPRKSDKCSFRTAVMDRTALPTNHYGEFTSYIEEWQKTLERAEPSPPRPPICRLFSEFKRFYNSLQNCPLHIRGISSIWGSRCHLHRARVAREKNDLDTFYIIRNEVINLWGNYLDNEKMWQARIQAGLDKMLTADLMADGHSRSPMTVAGPSSAGSTSTGSSGGGLSASPLTPQSTATLTGDVSILCGLGSAGYNSKRQRGSGDASDEVIEISDDDQDHKRVKIEAEAPPKWKGKQRADWIEILDD
ncbi:hypothetical protein K402DRAFT_399823 [Aulographum hederae CBS 113979]|uniref:Uncharacterized protein n=1 Tax=Aulographum hederae CBS 113979 TaxID=1176131 RepID=A0A6G1HFN5_9PEZI|nr:hypothetical protein K402DRAFT_399823 [Aulographum hederae CBS 113979]